MLMGLKSKIDILKNNHPKFFGFFKAVKKKAFKADSIFEIKVTSPEGEVLETSIRLTQSDIDAINDLANLAKTK